MRRFSCGRLVDLNEVDGGKFEVRMESVIEKPEKLESETGTLSNRLVNALDRRIHWIYPAPAVIILFLLFVIPIVYTVYLSFHSWNFSPRQPPLFNGIQNYIELVNEPRFHRAIFNTFYYTILALPVELVLGIGMALLFNRTFPGRGILRTIFLFPMMATPVAAMMGWRMLISPDVGIFGLVSSIFHVPPFAPLASDTWIIPTIAVIDTWQWTPFVTIILLAGLSSMPIEPFEAATIDGASPWQLFWYITLPLLRPFIVVALLFRLIDTLKVFETIYVLTSWGTGSNAETLNIYSFRTAFEYFQMGYGSALLVMFFGIVLAFGMMLVYMRRGKDASL